jgi:hypothetical protein
MLEHCCGVLLPFSHKSIINQSIKFIYIAIFTSADVTKCCSETQPKTNNSKQCRCRSTVARKNSGAPIHPKGVEVRALCRTVKFFHTHLDKPFLYGPRFVHDGAIVMLKQVKGLPQTAATKLDVQNRIESHCMLLR